MEGEDDTIDKEMFSNRLRELDKDLNSLHQKKSEIELELRDDQSQLITLEDMKDRLQQLEALLRSVCKQIKTLLHLIDLITVDKYKIIREIKMNFTEETQRHFIKCAPSGENPERASSVTRAKHQQSFTFKMHKNKHLIY